ncbi:MULTISPECIES: TetR/AcrR family transcriptional regulator [unclassified Shewanella]|uniref:TetR/AcrR family transcriptional regulator n=1 Tax=unclassified Shewanella TaxID=196818 RepID=UPI001BC0725A|nr:MULTISPECIES: TetR/AcrR family transcriptional regulator [unclassified Shewanella]GIU11224.1 TetR family transcriptional regulator [Shewanella sp. MBTL60-112-B1]GIU30913.1 TetR family transcriptional regulator [Shewanella sp. MBTL60-112-B2]
MKTSIKAPQQTRQHIIDSGYSLISSKGFSNVGLSQILKFADVPKGSFYHYFKSKEQFGEEIINSYFKTYLSSIDSLFSADNSCGLDRLMSYWLRWQSTQSDACIDQKCLVVKLSAEVADLSESMRLALDKGSSAVIARLAACIEVGIDDGSIPAINANYTAETLYQMWLGASLRNKLTRDPKVIERVLLMTEALLSQPVPILKQTRLK